MRSILFVRPIFIRLLTIVVLATLIAAVPALPRDLSPPRGPVLLTLTGKIAVRNREGEAVFDREMLVALGMHTIVTSTPWTDGVKRFEGVLLSDVLAWVAADDVTTLTATALNEYSVNIPASDASSYGVLLALQMDGKALTARDKGPLWIVYPRDDFSRIQDERYDMRWAWQLERIELK